MAVVEMKKVFVVSLSDYKERMVQQLQKMGILQIVDLKEKLSDPEWAAILQEDHLSEEISALDVKLSELKFAVDFLARYDQRKKSFLETFTGSKVVMNRDDFKAKAGRMDKAGELYRQCKALDEKLNELRNEEASCRSLIEQLTPWSELSVPLSEIKDTQHTRVLMGTVENDYLASLRDELAEISPTLYLQIVSADKHLSYAFLIYRPDDAPEAALRNANFSRVVFPELSRTPLESIQMLQKKIEKIAEDVKDVERQAMAMLSERPILFAIHDALAAEREQKSVVRNFARTERTFVIEGWVKAKDIESLSQAMHEITEAVAVDVREPEEGEAAPVALQNNPLVEPFEAVTELYALPVSGGYDPTPAMAPFFFIFFGAMLGDAGYGIVLSLLAWFAMKKIRMAGLGKKLFQLLFISGIASFLFGVLTGSYFGDLIKIKPIWFSPSDDPMRMILVSLAIGVVQVIYVGLGLKFYLEIKQGNTIEALCDVGSWIVFLTGIFLYYGGGILGPAVQTVGRVLLWAGMLTILLMTARGERNPLKRIGAGLYALYGISSYLGDVLSYSRLLALGLASAVIASVFNTMGGLLSSSGAVGTVLAVIFLIGAHAFNLIINVLGAYVHSSRLQYVEFFGKFYDSGGKKFSPFKVSTKYIELE